MNCSLNPQPKNLNPKPFTVTMTPGDVPYILNGAGTVVTMKDNKDYIRVLLYSRSLGLRV